MGETLDYLRTFARFPFALQRFLKHKLTLEDAKRIVHERMEHREENFLRIAERCIYEYSRSPYLLLLKMAGCELGDLRALVNRKGLEGALQELREEGVYVTFEEFKGRKPIVRNGKTIAVKPQDFDNPHMNASLAVESGGSTGASTRVNQDLENLAARAPHFFLKLSAYGVLDAPQVLWRGIIPDNTLNVLLRGAYVQKMPSRWFSNIGLRDSKYWVKYALATYYTLAWLRLYRTGVPFPSFVPVDQARVVADFLAETIRVHGCCLFTATISRALRVSLSACDAGYRLDGLTIVAGGEPITTAKAQGIEKSGARLFAEYALTEAGVVAWACLNSHDRSDLHLLKDGFGLITWPHPVEGFDISVPAIHLTSLLDATPKVLLNLETDDYGIVEERSCGCAAESYAFTTHLREIRSYSKLTGEGVTLIGNEMLHILEQVLPARFGGTLFDYQLMEEEDGRGFTRLSLLVSPRLNIHDEQAVIDCILNALSQSSPMADAAQTRWQSARTLQIKRQEPALTERGKFMPIHLWHGKSYQPKHPGGQP